MWRRIKAIGWMLLATIPLCLLLTGCASDYEYDKTHPLYSRATVEVADVPAQGQTGTCVGQAASRN